MGRTSLLLTAAVIASVPVVSCGQGAARYGLREECNDTAGWYEWDNTKDQNHVAPQVKSMASEDGKLVVECRRTLLRFAWNKPWVAPGAKRSAILRKDYGPVDLDKYHYMLCRIVEKGSGVFIGINGFDTKLGYTTGLTVVDLSDYDEVEKGTRPVRLELDLHENSTTFVLDEIALVSELTAEEKKALIPKGVVPRLENLEARRYHGLEALKDRCGAPLFPLEGQEQVICRDTATGAILTRLTASPRGDSFGEGGIWNANGACIFFNGNGRAGLPVYYIADARVQAGPAASKTQWSPEDPDKLYLLSGSWRSPTVSVWHRQTGQTEAIATLEPEKVGGYVEFHVIGKGGLMTVAYRETPCAFAIDPAKPEGQRVRTFELPTTLKGFSYSPETNRIRWANCYTYEGLYKDLATGEVKVAASFFVGHSSHGKTHTVGEFGRHLKIIAPHDLYTERRPGDKIKIWANYGGDVVTDYGRLTPDAEWIITNGTSGDVKNQHVMIPRKDPGSVLRLTRYFTTYYDWGSATYSRPSPDYTKLIFIQDVLDNPDLYMVYTRRPDPPTNVTFQDGVLTWEKPARSDEIAGYNVYRTLTSGRGYERLNDEPITTTRWAGLRLAGQMPFLAVTAVEHSGLEGLFSEEVGGTGPRTTVFEPERAKLTRPARIVYDGRCSDFRYVRITPETPDEKTGVVCLEIPAGQPAGAYRLWLRTRGSGAWTTSCDGGTLGASGKGKSLGTVQVGSAEWQWKAFPEVVSGGGGRVFLRSDDVDLAVDSLALQPADTPAPAGVEPRDTTAPPRPTGLSTEVLPDGRVKLTWDRSPTRDFWHFSVYARADADFKPGNETVIRSVKGTEITDTGGAPGGTVHYKLVAYDARMNGSEPATVSVRIPGRTLVKTYEVEDHLADQLKTVDGGKVTYVTSKENGGYVEIPVEVPEGWYRLWLDYTTFYEGGAVELSVDGRRLTAAGATSLRRHPSTISRRTLSPTTAHLFSDPVRLSLEKDTFHLNEGEHTLRLSWSRGQPLLDKVHLTNDASFRPAAYDPFVRPNLRGRGW